MGRKIRCTIIEVDNAHGAAAASGSAQPIHRDLPPWADPFIARLVEKHRIRAALADSLGFLAREAAHPTDAAPDLPPGRWRARFRMPGGDGPLPPD
ncbi:MAG: hypothetical protein HYX69_22705 [Planctomycetia bacterium]|nr:hypothetical protein [Planctomycetia bacterium]